MEGVAADDAPARRRAVPRRSTEPGTAPIRKSVNRKCFFSLMSSTPPRDGLAMASASGRVAAFSHVPLRLCKVDHGAAVVSTKTALLVAVPSLSDLERSGTWQAFLNKAAYCRRTNRPLYVFVGVPQLLHSRLDAPWAKCRERGSSASLKAVALLSLYEDPNPPDRVLYMEGTAFLSDLAFGDDEDAPEAYLALAPAAELVMRRDLDPLDPPHQAHGLVVAGARALVARPVRRRRCLASTLASTPVREASWSCVEINQWRPMASSSSRSRPSRPARAPGRRRPRSSRRRRRSATTRASRPNPTAETRRLWSSLKRCCCRRSPSANCRALDALIAESGSACAGGKCESFLASSWSFAWMFRWLLFLVVLGAGAPRGRRPAAPRAPGTGRAGCAARPRVR